MTRAELHAYPFLVMEAAVIRDKIRTARIPLESPRVPQLTGMPGAHNTQPGSQQERMADDLMEKLPALEEQLLELETKIRRIEAAVSSLPEKERLVTRLHCLEKWTYQAIGDKIHYSASTVSAIQMAAYKMLEERTDDSENV